MILSLPIQPIAKGRPQFSRRGGAYTPTKTRNFEKEVRTLASIKMREGNYRTLSGPLKVNIAFSLPKPKRPRSEFPITRPDIDNLAKAILDALNGVAWEDDGLICNLSLEKRYGIPSITIYVDKLNGETP